jgi:hypothetical protein
MNEILLSMRHTYISVTDFDLNSKVNNFQAISETQTAATQKDSYSTSISTVSTASREKNINDIDDAIPGANQTIATCDYFCTALSRIHIVACKVVR